MKKYIALLLVMANVIGFNAQAGSGWGKPLEAAFAIGLGSTVVGIPRRLGTMDLPRTSRAVQVTCNKDLAGLAGASVGYLLTTDDAGVLTQLAAAAIGAVVARALVPTNEIPAVSQSGTITGRELLQDRPQVSQVTSV